VTNDDDFKLLVGQYDAEAGAKRECPNLYLLYIKARRYKELSRQVAVFGIARTQHRGNDARKTNSNDERSPHLRNLLSLQANSATHLRMLDTPVIRSFNPAVGRDGGRAARARRQCAGRGLTLVHFSAQPRPFWSHLRVAPCLIDGGEIMHPMYPTKSTHVELNSGLV
jgi:hypothetical protein